MGLFGWCIPLCTLGAVFGYWMWYYSVWSSQRVPGPMPWPFLGNLLEQIRESNCRVFTKWQDKYGRIVGYYCGVLPMLSVTDLDMIREIFLNPSGNFTDRSLLHGLRERRLDTALFFAEGQTWKRIRKVMNHAYSCDKLKQMSKSIKLCSNHLVSTIEDKVCSDELIDIKEVFGSFAMNVIAGTGFGMQTGSQVEEGVPFVQVCKIICSDASFPGVSTIWFSLAWAFPCLAQFVGGVGFGPNSELFFTTMDQIVGSILEEDKPKSNQRPTDVLHILAGMEGDTETLSSSSGHKHTTEPPAVIPTTRRESKPFYLCHDCPVVFTRKASRDVHLRIQHDRFACTPCGELFSRKDNYLRHACLPKVKEPKPEDPPPPVVEIVHKKRPTTPSLPKHEIVTQGFDVLAEGYESTATTLQFLIYCTTMNPDVQEKICKEIHDQLGDEEPTLKVLSHLKYLEATIRETLRLYPPIPVIDRKAEKPITIKGVKIPADCGVTVPIYTILHDPKHFPHPEVFSPDRFLEENLSKIRPVLLELPFGYGPRKCIGEKMAMLEMKLAAVNVFRKFRFVKCAETPGNLKVGKGLGWLVSDVPIMVKAEIRDA